MPDVSFGGLLVVAAIAVTAPLVVGLVPALRVPAVVLEIVAGIVVGPSGLGWVRIDLPIQILSLLGLAFLLFLAALEIGLLLDKITPVTAAALVSAGLLSVVAFPPVALGLLRAGGEAQPVTRGSGWDTSRHASRPSSATWPTVMTLPVSPPARCRRWSREQKRLAPEQKSSMRWLQQPPSSGYHRTAPGRGSGSPAARVTASWRPQVGQRVRARASIPSAAGMPMASRAHQVLTSPPACSIRCPVVRRLRPCTARTWPSSESSMRPRARRCSTASSSTGPSLSTSSPGAGVRPRHSAWKPAMAIRRKAWATASLRSPTSNRSSAGWVIASPSVAGGGPLPRL
jgi:sodium/hydrogen exchanger family protein